MTATVEQAVRTPLWGHQHEALNFAAGKTALLLAHDMGAGKSLTAIELLERRAARRVLILCPKSVAAVWPDQLAQHAARHWHTWHGQVHGTRGPIQSPSVARRATAALQADTDAIKLGRPYACIVNYEASFQGQMKDLLLGTEWDAVILDESHRIKSPGGKASKLAATIAGRCRHRGGLVLALTGTPMPHSPLDVWAQVRALDGGERLGTNYHRFCQTYGAGENIWTAGGVQRTIYKGIRPDREDLFASKLADLMHRVSADDVLTLPQVTDVYRTFDLGPNARRVYAQLERDLIADIQDPDSTTGTPAAGWVVVAANAMVLVTRLAQTTSGFAANADTGETVALDTPSAKAVALADVLADIPQDEPVVVFCRFHADLDSVARVAENAGRAYGELSGRRRDGLDGPRLAAGVNVLGCQIKSGGTGIDLTAARHAIYFSLGFELADYEQSRKRLHRPGQTRPVTYTHLLAEGTVDRAVYGALRKRRDVVAAVIAHIKERQP